MSIKTMIDAYLECALWTGTDESTPSGGYPLDDNYTTDNIAAESRDRARVDCERFMSKADDLEYWNQIDDADLGHNFWLTRNGHGTGFWDRDLGELGDKLTDLSKSFGETDIYIGDDGALYLG